MDFYKSLPTQADLIKVTHGILHFTSITNLPLSARICLFAATIPKLLINSARLQDVVTILTDPSSEESLLERALNQLQDLVSQVDTANDLHVLGGLLPGAQIPC